jgi:hypothetical protein
VSLVGANTSLTKYLAKVGCQIFGQEILCPCFANFWQESVRERDEHALAAKILATNQTITTTQ